MFRSIERPNFRTPCSLGDIQALGALKPWLRSMPSLGLDNFKVGTWFGVFTFAGIRADATLRLNPAKYRDVVKSSREGRLSLHTVYAPTRPSGNAAFTRCQCTADCGSSQSSPWRATVARSAGARSSALQRSAARRLAVHAQAMSR
jgi:hypothetical protein